MPAVFTINELDSDTSGTDTLEFIEIYDGGEGNSSLDGLVLVLFNGSDDQSYTAIDLSGHTTDANGFFVVGNAGVANVDLVASNGFLQNGADAAALYTGSAADFPNDTAITTTNLLDVIIYDTNDADDTGLLTGFGQTVQHNEDQNGNKDLESLSRTTDGTGDFAAAAPTPGATNEGDPDPDPGTSIFRINEVDSDTTGTDTAEFIEIYDGGAGNSSLDGYVLVLYNGSDDQSYAAIDLDGQTTDANGYFVVGNAAVPNVDLVMSNGFLQNGPDAVALYVGNGTDFPNDTAITTTNLVDAVVYDTNDSDDSGLLTGLGETTQINEGGAGNKDTDSVSRSVDGTGDFTALPATPGVSNIPVPDFDLNEIRISSSGSSDDTSNFVEIFGAAGASLDGLTLLVISSEGDSGTIDFAFDLTGGATDADGIFLLGNNGSGYSFDSGDIQSSFDFSGSPLSFFLVQNFTGAAGDDLDTNDDGTFDVTPYGAAIDSVTLIDGDTTTDQTYSPTVVGPDGSFTPAHVSRPTDGEGNFSIGQFGDLSDDTPGTLNAGGGIGNPTPAAIYEIQGASHLSSYVSQIILTTGIVTAIDDNGFYMQDATGDGNAATSDGIFVFTNSVPTVAIGDEAQVTGEVEERGFSGGLTVTQIDAANVTVNSSGNTVPDAVIIGSGGITPPTEAIFTPADGATGAIDLSSAADAAADIFDPTQDGIDFYESLEGMFVTVEDAVSVAPASRFREIWAVTNQGAAATGFNERGGISVSEGDLNPEHLQIQINSDLGPDIDTSTVQTGDLLGNVSGVVSYSFGNYEVLATDIATPVAGGLEAEVTTLQGGENKLTVASFNVLNLDPGDTDQITRLADQIANNLLGPDIIGLQEVQDNNGTGTGTVASDQTLQALIDAITAAGGPTYSFAVVDPVAENTQGGQPNGNIRVAYLYNDDRVDLVPGSLQALDEATLIAAGVVESDAFNGSRIPLEAQFAFNGETVTLINNHFSSKSGSASLFGSSQPASEGGASRRIEQATALNEYVDSKLAATPDEKIVVIGDFNDFDFSEPLDILEGGSGDDQVLFNAVETIPVEADRYTFNFSGNSQAIDQFLTTENLASGTAIDIVHVNADFQNPASDHDPVLGQLTLGEVLPTTPVILFGTSSADELSGGHANDILYGKAGNDTLTGHGGDDVLGGSSGNDNIDAGAGNDVAYGGSGADNLIGGDGKDKLYASSGSDTMDGGDGNDILFAGSGDDIATSGTGDDIIYGSSGSDNIDGGDGNDTLYGGSHNDTIAGGAGDDLIYASSGDDSIDAGAGNDTLYAGSGDDTIAASEGDDLFYGSSGDNVFVFAGSTGSDTIVGFDLKDDTLDLAGTATDFTDIASIQNAATNTTVGGVSGVLIDLGGDSTVFLEWRTVDDLAEANFTF